MTTKIALGSIVEVTDRGTGKTQFAVVIPAPADSYVLAEHGEPVVWIRYDNGCEVPVREYFVRALTADQVAAKLNGR